MQTNQTYNNSTDGSNNLYTGPTTMQPATTTTTFVEYSQPTSFNQQQGTQSTFTQQPDQQFIQQPGMQPSFTQQSPSFIQQQQQQQQQPGQFSQNTTAPQPQYAVPFTHSIRTN